MTRSVPTCAAMATILVLIAMAGRAVAAERLKIWDWGPQTKPRTGKVIEAGDQGWDFGRAQVRGESDKDSKCLVLRVDLPAVTTSVFALRGQVRCDLPAGTAYLEMLTWFGEKGPSFTRGVSDSGPMARLSGSESFRFFSLPMRMKDGSPRPTRIELHVVIEGTGTVEVGPVELMEFAAGEDPLADPNAWWTPRQAGLYGGLGGGLVGLLGAIIGVVGGRGKGRRFVLTALTAMAAVGLVLLAVGAVALVRSQPYAVWYPLVLLGGLLAILGPAMLVVMRNRYRQIELRAMQAQDMT